MFSVRVDLQERRRDRITLIRYSYGVRRMTHLILICAKPILVSPNPNMITGPLERAEDLEDFRSP